MNSFGNEIKLFQIYTMAFIYIYEEAKNSTKAKHKKLSAKGEPKKIKHKNKTLKAECINTTDKTESKNATSICLVFALIFISRFCTYENCVSL